MRTPALPPRRPARRLSPTWLMPSLLGLLLLGCGGAPGPDRPPPEALRAFAEAGVLVKTGQVARGAERYDEAAALDPDSARIWQNSARARLLLGQWPEALDRIQKARALSPEDPDVFDDYIQILEGGGQKAEAREALELRTGTHPKDADAWLRLGRMMAQDGGLEIAEQHLLKVVEIEPTQADAWELLGQIRMRQGRNAAAASAYNEAATHAPDRSYLNKLILKLAMESGERDAARETLRRMSGPSAEPGLAELRLSAMLMERQDLLGAADELERLLEREPEVWRARVMLAFIFAQVGRDEDATGHLDLIPADSEAAGDALKLRVKMLIQGGDLDEAATQLTAALERDPAQLELVLDLVQVRRRQKRNEDAFELLAQARTRWPQDVSLLYLTGIFEQERGDEEAALTAMKGILEIEPSHAGALNFIGFTWAERNENIPEAERYIRMALLRRPEDGAIIDSLGWVLYRAGRFEEAEEALRRALAKSPKEGEIMYHLAEVLWARDQRAEAVETMSRAVERARDEATGRQYQKRLKAMKGQLKRKRPRKRRPRSSQK